MTRRPLAAALLVVSLAATPPTRAQSMDDWLGPDKALHFSVSAALAGGAYGVTSVFTERTAVRLGVGAGFALTLGIAKELYDATGAGDPSWRDLTWDLLGAGVGVLTAWLIDRAVHAATAPHPAR